MYLYLDRPRPLIEPNDRYSRGMFALVINHG